MALDYGSGAVFGFAHGEYCLKICDDWSSAYGLLHDIDKLNLMFRIIEIILEQLTLYHPSNRLYLALIKRTSLLEHLRSLFIIP